MTSLLLAASEVMARPDQASMPAARIATAALAASGLRGWVLLRCAGCRIGRCLLRWLERATLPGITAHYRWRKRRIEASTAHAIANGARQLIVLGAGFDSLAARMTAAHGALHAFEIDRAASVEAKRRALTAAGIDTGCLHVLTADLDRADPLAVLRCEPAFNAQAPTVVIAEGVLMYLPPAAVTALCRSLAGALTGSVLVIATVMDLDARGRPAFHHQPRWLHGWLRRRGEPFLWGVCNATMHATLRAMGLDLVSRADPDERGDPDPCPGEWLLQARLVRSIG